ncbi:M17 family peptidase N-terminal domain-containing protein [Elizabethkingia ursingii]|uniref:Peptidase M17 n=1 Tax=Elizabethkingia ursingii TaxID=1756150 RepID=A0AAJ3NFE0_9FLAO|nr:M17 family peptidase N-terminal domain-containing protein [Elizabethkingia ursingii]AQX10664.1 peptidase M17 [Elizabethkingia ursingii]OPB79698.1 peptidase M17 [Elizabethkingia ursingii]
MNTIEFKTIKKSLLLVGFSLITTISFAQQTTTANSSTTPAAIGTTKVWGSIEGIQMVGMVQGPSAANAELQVACVFEYTEGDIFVSPPALPPALNGLVHLDEALKGKLTEIRKTGEFKGHALETFLLTPPVKTLSAKKLLLIGLGDRNKFTPELMISVGEIATREALKLGVSNFAFASDLKDAGIDSPTALVAGNVVRGVVNEYHTQKILKSQKLTNFKPLSKVYLLAGPSFFEVAGGGIKEAIASLNN